MAKVRITQVRSKIGSTKRQKATIEALKELRDANMVAKHRGVSLDKVFNG